MQPQYAITFLALVTANIQHTVLNMFSTLQTGQQCKYMGYAKNWTVFTRVQLMYRVGQ